MRAAMGNRARTFQWKREGERGAREGKWKNGRRERPRQRLSSFYCILERKNSVMLTCSTQDVRPPRVLFCVVWLNNYHRLGYTEAYYGAPEVSSPVATVYVETAASRKDEREKEREDAALL